jgi:hypothetical protein
MTWVIAQPCRSLKNKFYVNVCPAICLYAGRASDPAPPALAIALRGVPPSRYTRKLWNGGMKKAAYPSG